MCVLFIKSLIFSHIALIYKKAVGCPFINLILQVIYFPETQLFYIFMNFSTVIVRDSFLSCVIRHHGITLGLFSHQVLFYSYMVFAICYCLEKTEDVALTWSAQCAGLTLASAETVRLIAVHFCVISASSSAEIHSDWVTLRYIMLNSPFQNLPEMEKWFSWKASALSAPYYTNTVFTLLLVSVILTQCDNHFLKLAWCIT